MVTVILAPPVSEKVGKKCVFWVGYRPVLKVHNEETLLWLVMWDWTIRKRI